MVNLWHIWHSRLFIVIESSKRFTITAIDPCPVPGIIYGEMWTPKSLGDPASLALPVVAAPWLLLVGLCSLFVAFLRCSMYLAFPTSLGVPSAFGFTLTASHTVPLVIQPCLPGLLLKSGWKFPWPHNFYILYAPTAALCRWCQGLPPLELVNLAGGCRGLSVAGWLRTVKWSQRIRFHSLSWCNSGAWCPEALFSVFYLCNFEPAKGEALLVPHIPSRHFSYCPVPKHLAYC